MVSHTLHYFLGFVGSSPLPISSDLSFILGIYWSHLEKRTQGDLLNAYKYLKGGCKEDGARLFPMAPSYRTRGNGLEPETQEAPSEHQETLFHCEGGRVLAQVAQIGCGVSIFRDIQKLSGRGPGQPALGGRA